MAVSGLWCRAQQRDASIIEGLLNPDRSENQYGWREPLLLDRLLLNRAHGVEPEHDASERCATLPVVESEAAEVERRAG
jgi:hypothetical protein